jgi:GPH family glycoside/pentoside/hexuronide:cation symporter
MNTDIKLSFGKKVRFGVGDFGMSVIIASLQFFQLFYYTDVVGIDPALAGTALLVGKLAWDMVNDGLFGYVIDKTKTKWGRRRPYIMFGAIPLALSFWLIYSLPSGMTNTAAFFAMLGTFVLFDTFGTFVNTAYSTMTAALTTDYNERTSLATVRMSFNVVGYIMGAGITTLLASVFESSFGWTSQQSWSAVGLLFGALAAGTLLITGFSKDLTPVVDEEPTKMPPLKALFSTFKNKPFRQFMVISGIMSIAFTIVTAMLAYFIKYQVMMEPQSAMIMLMMLGILALCLVPCKLVADKIGKAKTYALGIGIASVALLAAFFLPNQETMLIFAVAGVAGLGFSSQWVCPHSMMPDVVEYDELMTGERREGVYYGMWGMVGKVTGSFGTAFCGWGLKIFGYVKDVPQSETSLLGIRLLFAVVPAVLLLSCIPMLMKYPINKATHAQLMKDLAAKKAQAAPEE